MYNHTSILPWNRCIVLAIRNTGNYTTIQLYNYATIQLYIQLFLKICIIINLAKTLMFVECCCGKLGQTVPLLPSVSHFAPYTFGAMIMIFNSQTTDIICHLNRPRATELYILSNSCSSFLLA